MQQFNVPQFVEVEDKIFGPFTLRQFLVMVVGGIGVLGLWGIFSFGIFFWFLAVPIAFITVFIALGHFNGRPVLDHVFPLVTFFTSPKRLVFHRGAPEEIIQKAPPKKEVSALPSEEVRSRLRRLSYVLDQKAEQEEDLISNVKNQGQQS